MSREEDTRELFDSTTEIVDDVAPDAELVGDLSGRYPFAVQVATDPATARRETLREELLEAGDGFTLPDLLFGSRVRGGQLRIRVEEVVELAALRSELTRADVSELAVRDHPHVAFEGRPPTRVPGGERPRAIVEEHEPYVLFEIVAIEVSDALTARDAATDSATHDGPQPLDERCDVECLTVFDSRHAQEPR